MQGSGRHLFNAIRTFLHAGGVPPGPAYEAALVECTRQLEHPPRKRDALAMEAAARSCQPFTRDLRAAGAASGAILEALRGTNMGSPAMHGVDAALARRAMDHRTVWPLACAVRGDWPDRDAECDLPLPFDTLAVDTFATSRS